MKKLRLITLLGAFALLSTSALAIGLKADKTIKVVDKVEPAPKSKGCGGTIVTTNIILSSIALVGIVLLLLKRKEN